MGPVRILIVDDFEPWRRSIYSLLAADADLQVVCEASDGLEAVQKCEQLRPDLIVLDIQLPTMNGFDVARQISELSPSTKILFLSSHQSFDMMKEAMRIGSAFVVKANAARDLLPVVRAVIQNEPFLRFRLMEGGPSE